MLLDHAAEGKQHKPHVQRRLHAFDGVQHLRRPAHVVLVDEKELGVLHGQEGAERKQRPALGEGGVRQPHGLLRRLGA